MLNRLKPLNLLDFLKGNSTNKSNVQGIPGRKITLAMIGLAFFLTFPTSCGKEAPKEEPVKETVSKVVEAPDLKAETPAEETGETGNGVIAQISDIHFNPYFDPALFPKLQKADASQWETIFAASNVKGIGTYGDFKEETNYLLLASSIKNMAAVNKNPDFVIFTGDFLAHIFHQRYKEVNNNSEDGLDAFIDKVMTFFALLFEKHFPGVPVFFCLGNNDSYNGDYLVVPEGDFLKNSAAIFSNTLLKNPANQNAFSATYPTGGYYTVVPPKTVKTRIIALNAIFFSPKFKTGFTKYNPADKELQWFEEELKKAKEQQEKVWLLLHIPPGADVYGSLKQGSFKGDWVERYNNRFVQLLTHYAPIITAGFAGHTHMDDFRLLQSGDEPPKGLSFIHICPGISILFGNNPGFEKLTYNRGDFVLSDYEVYYIDAGVVPSDATTLPEWTKAYGFKEVYKQSAITPATLQRVYTGIKANETDRDLYMKHYDVNRGKAVTANNWQGYWCGISRWTQDGFNACTKPVK